MPKLKWQKKNISYLPFRARQKLRTSHSSELWRFMDNVVVEWRNLFLFRHLSRFTIATEAMSWHIRENFSCGCSVLCGYCAINSKSLLLWFYLKNKNTQNFLSKPQSCINCGRSCCHLALRWIFYDFIPRSLSLSLSLPFSLSVSLSLFCCVKKKQMLRALKR